MKIKYIKANPTENKTLLVETPVMREMQAEIAARLLSIDPDSEQVGFIEEPENDEALVRLQMMGGEFCGNAAISISAKCAAEENIYPGQEMMVPIEMSGTSETVLCRVCREKNGYKGRVALPLPDEIKLMEFQFEDKVWLLPVVFMKGIIHIIFPKESYFYGYEQFAQTAVKIWARKFNEDAVGLLLFDEKDFSLKPLVYVKATDSLYWERGCGTGTGAVGAYLAWKNKETAEIPVSQPGGIIEAAAAVDSIIGKVNALSITGKVIFEYEKEVDIVLD